jgi:hypothetical protein
MEITNIEDQVTGLEFDFSCKPISLSKEYPVQFSRLVEDTGKYTKDRLHFLKNPEVLCDSTFCRDDLSIGIFQSASLGRYFSRQVFSMYIAGSKHIRFECIEPSYRDYYQKEASRISRFSMFIHPSGLTNLRILIFHQILLNDELFQNIAPLDLELLHLVSCGWDLKAIDPNVPLAASFRRLHITQYDDAIVTNGRLLHSELEELIVNSHATRPRLLFLDAKKCEVLKHV